MESAQEYTAGMNYAEFCSDEKTIRAVIACFSEMGEAARCLPEDVKRDLPDVPWNMMVRMRNKLVHEYFRIEPEIIWGTIMNDLPVPLQRLKAYLRE